jgi:hypothetical protein
MFSGYLIQKPQLTTKAKGMKALKQIVFICLLIVVTGGCQKEQDPTVLWEIASDSKTSVIQKEVEGIEFRFCLLDEQGEPATVFNQEEYFSFSFSFKNQMQEMIIVTTEFITSDFFRVYQSETDTDMGKPWTGVWCNYDGRPHEIELQAPARKQLNAPWVLTDNNQPDYPLCMSESKEYLPVGEYYTKFELDFHFTMNGTNYIISDKIFKINFIIK